ncbi:MAG: ATP-binding protein [Candidatus Heimdallarchaeota archaeon]
MNTNIPIRKKSKITSIVLLGIFIIASTIFLFSMDFIRDLFGLEPSNLLFDFTKIFIYLGIVFGIILVVGFSIYIAKTIFSRLPLDGEFITSDLLIQKKKFMPNFRATIFIRVIGLPRKNISKSNRENLVSESNYDIKLDIVSSLAKLCEEVSFWIIKHENRLNIFFTISSWSWIKKEISLEKVKQNALSLEAAFKNIYPTIQFQNASFKDIQQFLTVVEGCPFGLEAKGIPAEKNTQVQIDRMINTFNNMNENGFFVTSFSEVTKGREKNLGSKNPGNDMELNELALDYQEAKKTGQSMCGIYAFSYTENGMHTLLAALLSIWSGTHTFKVNKLGNTTSKRIFDLIKKINPKKSNRISNKSLSCFIQLPEKPFLTEDTAQPIFEIPSYKENNDENIIVLGNIIQNDRILDEFSIPLDNFHYNTEIVGMIGRGKTYLTATIIEQILDKEIGCLIFDLKGEYAKLFVKEKNVLVYTIGSPAPLGINLFQMNSESDVQNVLALINEMLIIAGTPFSPTMLNIFETALQKIAKSENQNFEEFMYCLKESSNEYTKSMRTSYSRESIDAILNRLNFVFGGINYEVFSSLNNTIDFSYLDGGGKIIVDLSEYLRRGASTAALFLVCNLLLHLLSKHASVQGITNKLRYLVILEEAMYFIPKRFNLESTASLGYSEQNFIMGRSLGIGTISIYQLWGSVSPVVHANSITKILFRGEDIEKIKSSITLTEEQYEYLPYLPDRSFILKTKSLSRPALLKTKPFTRVPLHDHDYKNLANKKYKELGFNSDKVLKSFIEIRTNVFGGKINNSVKGKPDISFEQYSISKQSKRSSERLKRMQVTMNENEINPNYWESCIVSCPVRMEYKNKHSSWIKENVCNNIHTIAKQITAKLLKSNDLSPIVKIFENKPEYIAEKILQSYRKNSENENPKLVAFCAVNLMLDFLRKECKYSYAWKNKILNSIKIYITDKSISDYSFS